MFCFIWLLNTGLTVYVHVYRNRLRDQVFVGLFFQMSFVKLYASSDEEIRCVFDDN